MSRYERKKSCKSGNGEAIHEALNTGEADIVRRASKNFGLLVVVILPISLIYQRKALGLLQVWGFQKKHIQYC